MKMQSREYVSGYDEASKEGDYSVWTFGYWENGVLHITKQVVEKKVSVE